MLDRQTPVQEPGTPPVMPDGVPAAFVYDGRRPMIATLIVASALSPLAINIFIPSMASIAGDLSASSTQVGLGLSLYLAATALIQLVAGPLSDRFGRRPIILAGMVLFLFGTLLCILAPTIELFLAGRITQAASATGIALSRAVVRDVFPREQAASMLGYITMGYAVAPMFGPAIGGFIDIWAGWRAVFWLLGGIGVLTIALVYFDLSETNTRRGQAMRAQWRGYGLLLRTPAFWSYTGLAALVSAVFFAFLGAAPFIAVQGLGMSPAAYGIWFMLCSIGYIAGNFLVGRLSESVGLQRLAILGAALSSCGAGICVVAFGFGWVSPLTLFGPLLIVGFGNGLAVPTSTAGGLSVRPEAAGAAAGLLGACQIGAGALTTVLAASMSGSPFAVAVLMMVLGLGSFACALSTRREAAA